MFTLESTVPVAKSICDGTPTPTASGWPQRSTTSATADSIPASSCSVLSTSVGCSTPSWAAAPSMRATATFVPPTSMPSTQLTASFFARGASVCKRARITEP